VIESSRFGKALQQPACAIKILMPSVRFVPADITVEVPIGTLISEAAALAGIEDLQLPCGGKGTCGKCLVGIESDQPPELIGHTHLDAALAEKGLVLSCQTKIRGDSVVSIRQPHERLMRAIGDSHMLVSEELLPGESELEPLYRTEKLVVPPASVEAHYSDWQRLVHELSPPVRGRTSARTDSTVLRNLASAVREKDGQVTVSVSQDDAGLKVLQVLPGHVHVQAYGLAIDVGTTTVDMQLLDLPTGRVLVSGASYNGQIRRGADIISRIDYARTPERQEELRRLVLDTINGLITGRAADAGVPTEEIRAVFISGNTTMIHLLLGLPPRHIREAPYVPTVNPVPTLSAKEVGLAVDPAAVVAFAPGVGSYVGGDITAGLLCTDLPVKHDEVFLFMDIGTNAEIVLGNADWMVTCACSAGPAFEGAGIKCGMRAAQGAIEYVEISDGGGSVSYDVIGGPCKPAGICGSGLICLLGELFVRGVVDQSGRFNTDLGTDRLVEPDGSAARTGFVIEWGANTHGGSDLIITEHDIENLVRTKAAIYAGCSHILGNVGLGWDVISRVYIAGGFGRYLQVEDAVLIGLLPDLPYEKFTYIGNSSLTGAYMALLSQERRRELQSIASKMTYIDLSSDPKYMDSYLAAMFLPHTDMSQFPSVSQRLAEAREKNTGGSTR
jgi:uncharacterized 2Fe-2S/4Fe-4S cluster protein (DUF4445 family)